MVTTTLFCPPTLPCSVCTPTLQCSFCAHEVGLKYYNTDYFGQKSREIKLYMHTHIRIHYGIQSFVSWTELILISSLWFMNGSYFTPSVFMTAYKTNFHVYIHTNLWLNIICDMTYDLIIQCKYEFVYSVGSLDCY